MKVTGRLRTKFNGRLENFELDAEIAKQLPKGWEFISKLDVPKWVKNRYAMLYGED